MELLRHREDHLLVNYVQKSQLMLWESAECDCYSFTGQRNCNSHKSAGCDPM